jgi:transcriptional regulator with XRE-family HTH domain
MAADAALVRRARERLGLTQLELGQLLDVHWVTVSRWENGVGELSEYQRDLLRKFEAASPQKNDELGREIMAVLVAVGAAAALFFILKQVFEEGGSHGSKR